MSRVAAPPVVLLPVALALPSEAHDPGHARDLARDMRACAMWRIPIVLEHASGAVMDGHHRLAAAHLLGLARIPCLRLDYRRVRVHASRPGYVVSPAEILRRARHGDPYPPKTTRHTFEAPLPVCNISLRLLGA